MDIIIVANKKRFPVAFLIGLSASIIFYVAIKTDDGNTPWYYYMPAFIALFIYAFIFTMIALFDYLRTTLGRNAFLKISDEELYDSLSFFSCGYIAWSDITNVEIVKAYTADFLIIKLLSNDKYINNKNFIQRYILQKFIKKWGSPVVISEKRSNYNLYRLKDIITEQKDKVLTIIRKF